jgi:IclR family transcriptional regulator, KDG regulon repressor
MENRNRCIASVAGVFQVLEAFSTAGRPVSFSEICRVTGKSKATVHRVLSTLTVLGLIKRAETTGEYMLSLKLWSLGMGAFAALDLVKIAQPHVERLMKATDETAHLATLDGPHCVTYLSKFESAQSIRAQFWVGKRVRSWCSATGRSMLAYLPRTVDELLRAKSEIDSDALSSVLRKVTKQGYAMTKGDNHPDMGGIAAPIMDHAGVAIASCGIAIPAFRMSRYLIQRCAPHVVRTALAISKELGPPASVRQKKREPTYA